MISLNMRFILTLFILLFGNPLKSQTDWENCCRGYEEGYKKGYSYPDMIYSNTVVPPPCGCNKIIGGQSYQAGFAVGFEDGRIKKSNDDYKKPNNSQNNQLKFQTSPYVPAIPFNDFKSAIEKINLENESTAEQINYYIKYRDIRRYELVRQCDINYYIQETNKMDKAVADLFNSSNQTTTSKLNQYIDWINQFESDQLMIDMINNSRLHNETLKSVESLKQSGLDPNFNKKIQTASNAIDASTAHGYALYILYQRVSKWKNDPSIYATLKNQSINKAEFLKLIDFFNEQKLKINGCYAGDCKNGYGIIYQWGFKDEPPRIAQKFPLITIEGFFKNGLKNGTVTTTWRNVGTGVPVNIITEIYRNDTAVETIVRKSFSEGTLESMDSMNVSLRNLDKNRQVKVIRETDKFSWFYCTHFESRRLYKFENIKTKAFDYSMINNTDHKEGTAYSIDYWSNLKKGSDTNAFYYGGFRQFDWTAMYWQKHGIGTVINNDGNRDTRIWDNDNPKSDTLRITEYPKNIQIAPEYKLLYYAKECISTDPTKYSFCYFIKEDKVYKYYFEDKKIETTAIQKTVFVKRFERLIKHRKKYFGIV